MSATICLCNDGIANTGLPLCTVLEKVTKKVVFVQLVANDGTLNYINPGTSLNAAWLTGKLNNTDKSKRFFPTPEIKNIDTPKDAAVFEKYKDDSSYFVRESVRKFTGIIPACPPMYKSKLESLRCNSTVGCYLIDLEGNWRGLTNEVDGYLYPFPINAQSVVGNVVNANDDNTQQIAVNFEFPATMRDGDMRMISSNAFEGFSLSQITGLLDVTGVVSAISTTGFTLTLVTPSPALDQPIAVQGLTDTNFVGYISGTVDKIYNSTDAADIGVTVTEGAAGVYAVVVAAQTTADVLKIKMDADGYDFSEVNPTNNPIVIP